MQTQSNLHFARPTSSSASAILDLLFMVDRLLLVEIFDVFEGRWTCKFCHSQKVKYSSLQQRRTALFPSRDSKLSQLYKVFPHSERRQAHGNLYRSSAMSAQVLYTNVLRSIKSDFTISTSTGFEGIVKMKCTRSSFTSIVLLSSILHHISCRLLSVITTCLDSCQPRSSSPLKHYSHHTGSKRHLLATLETCAPITPGAGPLTVPDAANAFAIKAAYA